MEIYIYMYDMYILLYCIIYDIYIYIYDYNYIDDRYMKIYVEYMVINHKHDSWDDSPSS